MFEKAIIAPSILSADFMNMEASIRAIERGGAQMIHLDVMDGHFVPNITMGIPLLKQLKQASALPIDAHLMISNPLTQIPWFIEAGADIIMVHYESFDSEKDCFEAIELIRAGNALPGIALKPSTPVSVLEPFISKLHMILIMSVYPGFSGQSYIDGSENRVSELVAMAKEQNASPLIQVDGGIDNSTISRVACAGADVFVAGNAVYKAHDIAQAIQGLLKNASCAFECEG